jgi:nucleotide-binding universal stress UspA family protein
MSNRVRSERDPDGLQEWRRNRFRILVCIDGSDESYRGLRYAARLGKAPDADIILLYVRPVDQGMRTGGLQVRVARENMLDWGLELPGVKFLKKGLDQLWDDYDLGDSWKERIAHTDVAGDPLGDNKIEYVNDDGKAIVLKLKTAPDVATGILDQYELGPYNLIIVGASGRWSSISKTFFDPAVAEKVAIHAPCSVLVTRELEGGRGHLICTDGSDRSLEAVHKVGDIVNRLGGKAHVLSVALDEDGRADALEHVDVAKETLLRKHVEVTGAEVRVGNPVDEIIELGTNFSLIAVADSDAKGIRRFFMGSVAFKVVEHAHNSVMVVR